MRISELVEAVAPIGSTTDPIGPNGLPKSTPPTTAAPGQTPSTVQPTPAPTLGNQQPAGQTPQAAQTAAQPQPALQQGMKDTMTDLDKIAAQIVGLKQKQQQMQQKMQQTPTV